MPFLQRGKAIEPELAGGREHLYRVPMEAGGYAGLAVEQRGIDVVVQVLDPDGKSVVDFDSEITPQGKELAGLVADAAGNYRVRIKATYPKADAALRDPPGGGAARGGSGSRRIRGA